MKSLQLRRLEAEVRSNRRRGLSPVMQLQILADRPGEAKRERRRLTDLPAEKPVQPTPKNGHQSPHGRKAKRKQEL